jgi:hypothetical protein
MILTLFRSDVVRFPSPGSINPDDSVDLTRLSSLNSTKTWRELGALAEDGAAGSEEQVFYQLLGKGGPTANSAAFHIVFSSAFQRVRAAKSCMVTTV